MTFHLFCKWLETLLVDLLCNYPVAHTSQYEVACGGVLTKECGDEDTRVQVQGGVPPAVREIQYLSWPNGTFKGSLCDPKSGVGLADPGQGSVVWMELWTLIRRIKEPSLSAINNLRVTRSMPVEWDTCARTCYAKAVCCTCMRDFVGRSIIFLKQCMPLCEVVIPKEVQSITAKGVNRLRAQKDIHKILKGHIHFSVGMCICCTESHYFLTVFSE